MTNFEINILTFDHGSPVTLPFFKEQQAKKNITLKRSEIPHEVYRSLPEKEQEQLKRVYTDFVTKENADFELEVDLSKSFRFARYYYNHLIQDYFKERATYVTDNYINDVEVWFHNQSQSTPRYNAYNVYTLKVQMARMSEYPELVIYENGISRISTKSVLDIENLPDELIKTVVYEDNLYRYEDNPNLRGKKDTIYPLLSNKIATILGISPLPKPPGTKYERIHSLIRSFISNHLDNEQFKSLIKLHSTELLTIKEGDGKLFKTKRASSYINLGLDNNNKVSVLTPKGNLKEHGPYSIPSKPVKFIMIFHKPDREYANKLYMIFKRLYKTKQNKVDKDRFGTSLFEYIRIDYDLDTDKSIAFEDMNNPHDDIQDFLDNNKIDYENNNYVAIYLSPYPKEEADPSKHKVYYEIKKTLLFHNITSQAIYRDNLDSKYFRSLYYQNIAAAILAKTGGIPWKLATEQTNEMVVGIGAFKSREFDVQYIGSAFCFSNNGDFQEFNCMAKRKSDLLAHEIKQYLESYIEKHGVPERLVIHYYKKMSREDIEPIDRMIHQLGFGDIPIIVITINKTLSKDYIVFDKNAPEILIPPSGTIVNYAKNQYLLFNNTRYIGSDTSIESYHLPLKLSFWSNSPEAIKDVAVIKELIDQIYQFSRMYWKSVKQQNLPVTIKYPEMVAKMFPYFELEEIPEFGRSNMWFL